MRPGSMNGTDPLELAAWVMQRHRTNDHERGGCGTEAETMVCILAREVVRLRETMEEWDAYIPTPDRSRRKRERARIKLELQRSAERLHGRVSS